MALSTLSLLALSCVVEVVAVVIAVVAASGGHGSYVPAKLLFPWTMALTGVTESISAPLVVIALAQFPVYGLMLAKRRWRRGTVAGVLLAAHALAIPVAFALSSTGFTP